MRQIKYICVVLTAMLLAPANVAMAQDNVFQRGITAVKNFFKGNKDRKEPADSLQNQKEDAPKRKSRKTAVQQDYTLEQLYELTLDENLSVPVVPADVKEVVKAYQLVQARKLVAAGYNVETMRGGEVVIATIQSDELFNPNDTVLAPKAGKQLRSFAQFLRVPDMYRMMLVMHSDNTGTAAYTDALTSSRVLAVLDWFESNATDTDYIIPYAMGASEPLFLNNSISNRQRNRRLEIYLVPGKTLIGLASEGRLTY